MTTTGNNQQQHPDEGVVAASYKSALLHRLWIQSSATAARRRITTLSSLLPSLLLLFKERILPAPSPLWNPRYLSETIYLLLQIGIMRIIRSSSGILQFPLPGGGGGRGGRKRGRGDELIQDRSIGLIIAKRFASVAFAVKWSISGFLYSGILLEFLLRIIQRYWRSLERERLPLSTWAIYCTTSDPLGILFWGFFRLFHCKKKRSFEGVSISSQSWILFVIFL